MKRGDMTQMSFGFVTIRDHWETKDEMQIRTLLEVRLMDVSVVTFPAYPDTSVAVRSQQAWHDSSGMAQDEILRKRQQMAEASVALTRAASTRMPRYWDEWAMRREQKMVETELKKMPASWYTQKRGYVHFNFPEDADNFSFAPHVRERRRYLTAQGMLPSRMGLTCVHLRLAELQVTEPYETLNFSRAQNRAKLDSAIMFARRDVAEYETQLLRA